MLAAGCPTGGITDAGRTYAEQKAIYDQWKREVVLPVSQRRYKATAAKPGTSKHETGRALDLAGAALAWVRAHGREYGWLADRVKGEPWHVEYHAAYDKHAGKAPATATPATPEPEEAPLMRTIGHPDRGGWLVGPGFEPINLEPKEEWPQLREYAESGHLPHTEFPAGPAGARAFDIHKAIYARTVTCPDPEALAEAIVAALPATGGLTAEEIAAAVREAINGATATLRTVS